jgi:hypothetical protein
MRLATRLFAAVFVLAASTLAAKADTFDYQFSFSNLSNGDADFSLNILTSGLITTTDFSPLATPLPTTLGYPVNNFGENHFGQFLFSNAGGGELILMALHSSHLRHSFSTRVNPLATIFKRREFSPVS